MVCPRKCVFHLNGWTYFPLQVAPKRPVCWFTWVILGVWPVLALLGVLIQWKVTAEGYSHTERKWHFFNSDRLCWTSVRLKPSSINHGNCVRWGIASLIERNSVYAYLIVTAVIGLPWWFMWCVVKGNKKVLLQNLVIMWSLIEFCYYNFLNWLEIAQLCEGMNAKKC